MIQIINNVNFFSFLLLSLPFNAKGENIMNSGGSPFQADPNITFRFRRYDTRVIPLPFKGNNSNRLWLEFQPTLDYRWIDLDKVDLPRDPSQLAQVQGLIFGKQLLLFGPDKTYILPHEATSLNADPQFENNLEIQVSSSIDFQAKGVVSLLKHPNFIITYNIDKKTKRSSIMTILGLYTYDSDSETIEENDAIKIQSEELNRLSQWKYMASYSNIHFTYLAIFIEINKTGSTHLFRFCSGSGLKPFSVTSLPNKVETEAGDRTNNPRSVGAAFIDRSNDPKLTPALKEVLVDGLKGLNETKGEFNVYSVSELNRQVEDKYRQCYDGTGSSILSFEEFLSGTGSVACNKENVKNVKRKAPCDANNKNLVIYLAEGNEEVVRKKIKLKDHLEDFTIVSLNYPESKELIVAVTAKNVQKCLFKIDGNVENCISSPFDEKDIGLTSPTLSYDPFHGRVVTTFPGRSKSFYPSMIFDCNKLDAKDCYSCEIFARPFSCSWDGAACSSKADTKPALQTPRSKSKRSVYPGYSHPCNTIQSFSPDKHNGSVSPYVASIQLASPIPGNFHINHVFLGKTACDEFSIKETNISCSIKDPEGGHIQVMVVVVPNVYYWPYEPFRIVSDTLLYVKKPAFGGFFLILIIILFLLLLMALAAVALYASNQTNRFKNIASSSKAKEAGAGLKRSSKEKQTDKPKEPPNSLISNLKANLKANLKTKSKESSPAKSGSAEKLPKPKSLTFASSDPVEEKLSDKSVFSLPWL